MTSTDVEIFKSGLEDLKYYIDNRVSELGKRTDVQFSEVRSEIRKVNDNVLVNSAKIDAYRDFTGIGFTILAIVATLIGFVITLAPMFREMYRDAKRVKDESKLTRTEVQEMIAEAISRALKG